MCNTQHTVKENVYTVIFVQELCVVMLDNNLGYANDKQQYCVYKYLPLIECIRRTEREYCKFRGKGKMTIKMIPAQYGDCFWINTNNKFNILVDGGLRSTYTKWIKPLVSLEDKRETIFDLVIVTHIDRDHIGGIIALLENCKKSQGMGVKEIWHNGLFQIVGEKFLEHTDQNAERDEKILDSIIKKGYLSGEPQNIGVSESFALDILIQEKSIVRNLGNEGDAICDKTEDYIIGKLTKIVVLGPEKESIKAMDKYWQKEMIARNYRFQVKNRIKLMKAFEFQMSAVNNYYAPPELKVSGADSIELYLSNLGKEDDSVTNRSSICFVIEEGKHKILFLGDTVICDNGSIIEQLEKKYGKEYHFTAIKLPHHGSEYNVSVNFIKRYTADEYYFSTNSKCSEHPSIGVIADIIYYTREYSKKLIFNYPLEVIKRFDRNDWKQKYHYDLVIGNGEEVVKRSYE